MVPGNFGLGSVVLAAMTTLAPSAAARFAMVKPMPRDAPVMKSVLPLRLMPFSSEFGKIWLAFVHERAQGFARRRLAQHASEALSFLGHLLQHELLPSVLHQRFRFRQRAGRFGRELL